MRRFDLVHGAHAHLLKFGLERSGLRVTNLRSRLLCSGAQRICFAPRFSDSFVGCSNCKVLCLCRCCSVAKALLDARATLVEHLRNGAERNGAQHQDKEAEVCRGDDDPEEVEAQPGTFGFDEKGMDKTAAPGDDFYTFANGAWAKGTPIPADKSNYGMFTVLDDLSKQRVRGILDAVKGDANSAIGRAYTSYLDTATV